jgi:hypothetical protein
VSIDPLQTVRLLSDICPQLFTAIHTAKQPPTRSEAAVLSTQAQRTQYIVALILQDRK